MVAVAHVDADELVAAEFDRNYRETAALRYSAENLNSEQHTVAVVVD